MQYNKKLQIICVSIILSITSIIFGEISKIDSKIATSTLKAIYQTNINTNPTEDLFTAAANGNLPDIRFLITEENTNIEAKNNQGNTPLILAAFHGHTTTVTELINSGAHIEAKNNDGITSLIFAAANGHIDIVNVLQKALSKK